MTCPPRNKGPHPGHPAPGRSAGILPAASRSGFTLIEIVIVLMIIGLVTGGSIAALMLTSSERALRNASGEIELLAKKARTASILNQTPYAIEFRPGQVRLLPFSESSPSGLTTALGNPIGGTAVEPGARSSIRQEVMIDPDITLSVRRWNTAAFIIPDEDEIQIWRFDPDGLSEPLTVRLTLGESYAQDSYHPLTATIADSELEAN